MSVTVAHNRVQYVAGSGQTTFAYTFPITSATDLKVYINASLRTLNVHYTVTGVGVASGGNVVLTTGAALNDKVLILGQLPIDQLTDYIENDPFPAAAHEAAIDKLTRIAQQLKEITDRCLQLNVALSFDKTGLELPVPSLAPDGGVTSWVARWNALHTNLEIMQLTTQTGLVGDVIPSSTFAGLPAPGTPGKLRRVTDTIAGLYFDSGTAWQHMNAKRVDVASYANLAAAIDDISSTPTILVLSRNETLAATKTIHANTTLERTAGAKITVSGGFTLTVNGAIDADRHLLFDGAGSVKFGELAAERVFPEWFGAVRDGSTDDGPAFNLMVGAITGAGTSFSGHIKLALGMYRINTQVTFPAGWEAITIEGEGYFASDTRLSANANITGMQKFLYFERAGGEIMHHISA